MRIGIEASAALTRERSGVGNYTAHLIAGMRRLQHRASNLDLVFFSNRYDVQSGENLAGLDPDELYPQDRVPSRLLWMQTGLARSIRRSNLDLCHFPNHLGPVLAQSDVPFVVTMHDMSVYRCPEHHTWKTVAVHRAIMPALIRRHSWIVTVSESARNDIVEYLGVPPERVRVVYSGIDRRFCPVPDSRDADVLLRYGLGFPYILTVGTLEPRKNHARLIDAFGELVRQEGLPHHLVIVGARGWKHDTLLERARMSPLSDRIHVVGFVPSADLPALYRAADAFAFPSLYEGFGLPVLESLASGTPTLISHDPALTEVAGRAATVAVDAMSPGDIARGLHRILTDGSLRASLRRAALERAAAFSWESCTARTLDVYREIVQDGASPRRAVAV